MAVTHDKVQTTRVPRGAFIVSGIRGILSNVLTIGYSKVGIALGFLAKDNRGGLGLHPVPQSQHGRNQRDRWAVVRVAAGIRLSLRTARGEPPENLVG